MLVVETIAKIRRAYFHRNKPIKQICRELKLSRKVVRKVIRSGKTEFTYERSVQPMPRLGPWRDDLDRLLEENARQSKRVLNIKGRSYRLRDLEDVLKRAQA